MIYYEHLIKLLMVYSRKKRIRMKRTLIVIMALCAALAFTACGKSSSNTETTPAPTTAEPETKEPATTPAATLEAPGNTAEFKILTCSVESVSDTLEYMRVKNGDTEVKFKMCIRDRQ